MSRKRTTCLAAALVGQLLISSCGGGGGEPVSLPHFTPDLAHWRTPLDAYVVDPAREQYARDLVYGECLREKGYVPPALQDEGAFIPPTFNGNVRLMFSLEIAQQYGYHKGEPAGVVHEEPATSDEESRARSACSSRATKELALSEQQANVVYSYKGAAYKTAIAADEVTAAGKAWRTCMLPLGLPDLPREFEDGAMPTDSQRRRFGMPTSGAVDVLSGSMPTTVVEIREATFDARCREESGLTQAMYDVEVATQLGYIEEAREDFSKTYQAAQENTSQLDEVIARYGG